jgi:hypothetical protein
VNWRLLGLAVVWTLNTVGLAVILLAFLNADVGFDWILFTEAGSRFAEGGLYDWAGTVSYRYSPVLAAFFAVITPIGYLGWSALHFGALLALPRRMAVFALVAFPFWADVYNGNTMTFVFVAAAAALAGSRAGALAFLALTILIPRPLMLPIAIWLLWKRRELILPFALIFLAHAGLVVASGWGDEWVANLLTRGTDDLANRGDFGPSRLIGLWWYPVGLVVAAWFAMRGRLGLASLAASPYWLSHYFLMLLLEIRPRHR